MIKLSANKYFCTNVHNLKFGVIKVKSRWAWKHTPIIPATQEVKEEGLQFNANLWKRLYLKNKLSK
jgi:hypothetical protein